ncbi:ATP-dependent DNA helicase [Gordonia bronchialis]|uniref:ATP-dependent DNA helicase n=1 Tax=Gordonia bronchialis TaxID=2054 RepID=UPI0022393A4B|nr:AAA family ATPase [Gordonia bronchialis]
MASTADLDTVIRFVCARGGSVRLVGDDQQLASISAGGVLRDIAHETGALTLSQVVRFSDPAEGAASLALRDGDPAALGFYADAGRVHVAADTVAVEQAYTAWAHDRDTGRDTVMLAATRDTVNALNERARADRLAADPAAPHAAVQLSDGLQASIGDLICTRSNRRDLRLSATDWVRNGDRWQVTALGADGALTAQHLDTGRLITLPADYVADNTTLGYASTIHAAQGMTADTCHVVGSDALTRQLLYVALTRGRHANHIYLATAETDPHNATTPKARHPNTGLETLAAILERDGAQQSATTAAREATDPATPATPCCRGIRPRRRRRRRRRPRRRGTPGARTRRRQPLQHPDRTPNRHPHRRPRLARPASPPGHPAATRSRPAAPSRHGHRHARTRHR